MERANREIESYFDRDYFEAGYKKGNRYADYLRNAMESTIYRGIGKAIMEVFKPRRVLEIGCAAGPIVRQLNDMGCEAHGIDVSQWAVENRFHPNVILASADDLPYETGSFDLVFSCHALEHLPDGIVEGGLAEIGRVSGRYQFHMMPIIGIPPYDGPLDQVLENLHSDPTHNQLHNRAWWLENWARHGWRPIPSNIMLDADNAAFEFSSCQVLLSREGVDEVLLQSIHEFNLSFFKRVSLWKLTGNANRAMPSESAEPSHLGPSRMTSSLILRNSAWGDLIFPLRELGDLRDASVQLSCTLRSEGPVKLRMAAVTLKPGVKPEAFGQTDIEGVAQSEFNLQPGYSVIELPLADFRLSYGSPRPDRLNVLMCGGESARPAELECNCVLNMPVMSERPTIQLIRQRRSVRVIRRILERSRRTTIRLVGRASLRR